MKKKIESPKKILITFLNRSEHKDPGINFNLSPCLQVLLFKNGQPILRVERGTTLSVIKLLYQADPRNKGTVIALRPETQDPLPCVLTLDQSPLEEAKYEIITHGMLIHVSFFPNLGQMVTYFYNTTLHVNSKCKERLNMQYFPYSPYRRDLLFLGGGWGLKDQNFLRNA